jgi:hypothetical protein
MIITIPRLAQIRTTGSARFPLHFTAAMQSLTGLARNLFARPQGMVRHSPGDDDKD